MKKLFAGLAILASVSAAKADDFIFERVSPVPDMLDIPSGDYANFIVTDPQGKEVIPPKEKAEGVDAWRVGVSCMDIFQSSGASVINETLQTAGFDEDYRARMEAKINQALRAAEWECSRLNMS